MDALRATSFPEPRTRGERAKLKLVEAALRCLADDGAEAVTFEAVGNIAGVNRSQVRYHYRELRDLLLDATRHVVRLAQQHTIKRLEGAKDPGQSLDRYIEAAFEAAALHPYQLPTLFHAFSRAASDDDYAAIYDQARRLGTDRLYAMVEPLLASRSAAAKKALRSACEGIQLTLLGYLIEMHCRKRYRNHGQYAALAKRQAKAMLAPLTRERD